MKNVTDLLRDKASYYLEHKCKTIEKGDLQIG